MHLKKKAGNTHIVWMILMIFPFASSCGEQESEQKESAASTAGSGDYDLANFDLTGVCTATLSESASLRRECCEETTDFDADTRFVLGKVSTADSPPTIVSNPFEGNLSKVDFQIPLSSLNLDETCTEEELLAGNTTYLVLADFKVMSREGSSDNSTGESPSESSQGAAAELCTVKSGERVTGINAVNKKCSNYPSISSPSDAGSTFSCVLSGVIESIITLGTAGTVTFDTVPSACEGKVDTSTRYDHNNLYTLPLRIKER